MQFKKYLEDSGISQKKLAQMLGKSQKLVSNWCNGYCEPQIKELLALQKILDIDFETLLKSFAKEKPK